MTTKENFFCHLPFINIHTNGTTARPCCKFSGPGVPLKDYDKNPVIIDIKQKLFRGVAPKQCSRCVEEEAKSGASFRTLANKFHPHYTKEVLEYDENYSAIKTVDVVGSNVCNLKCLPCQNSSYIRDKELYDLGLLKQEPKTYRLDQWQNILDLDIESLTLCSGEPFYDKETWKLVQSLSDSGKSKKIRLDINTNLTHITDEKLDFLLTNFAAVKIKGSIDGVGAVNDYLRYPSQWHQIERAVDIISHKPEIEFIITTALSNLALIRYHEVFSWCLDQRIKDLFISQVTNPRILACNRLPKHLKDRLLPIYQNLKNIPDLTDRSIYCLDLCVQLCETEDEIDMPDLIRYLDLHDGNRGTDWRKVFSDLAQEV